MAVVRSVEGKAGLGSSFGAGFVVSLRYAIAAFVLLVLVLPRFVPLIAAAIASIVLLVLYVQDRFFGDGKSSLPWLAPSPVTWLTLGLLGVLLIACTWSVEPFDGLEKVAFLAAVCFVAIVLSQQSEFWPPRVIEAIAQGLVIGMAIGSIYIFVDTVTGRGLTKAVHNWFPMLWEGHEKHYRFTKQGDIRNISHAIINRATFAYSILLWPAALSLLTSFKGLWPRLILGTPLVITAVSIVLYSTHQSSQLSIFLSAIAFGLSLACLRCGRLLTVAGICALYLLIIPFSLYAQSAGWQVDKNIMATARARLIFWAYTSERILEKPFLGVGTNSTRAIDAERARETLVKPKDYVVPPRTMIHPHSSYLQIWYEVGLLGALAALAWHLGLAWRSFSLPEFAQSYAIAHVTLSSLIVLPSYGLWQTWFHAVIGFSIFALVVAGRQAKPARP